MYKNRQNKRAKPIAQKNTFVCAWVVKYINLICDNNNS